MATTYTAKEGERVSYIAWKFYGSTTNRVVEQVLEANRGLADYGARLPAGVIVTLPDISSPAQEQGTRLWD